MNTDRWRSVQGTAADLRARTDTIDTRIENKDMPAHKVGRLWKLKVSEVDAWVRSGKAAQKDEG